MASLQLGTHAHADQRRHENPDSKVCIGPRVGHITQNARVEYVRGISKQDVINEARANNRTVHFLDGLVI